jgi:glutaryl-CoA dehydrogenase
MTDSDRRRPAPVQADFYGYFSLLTEEENAIRLKVRRFMDEEVAPTVNACWEAAEFPRALIDPLRELNLLADWYRGEAEPSVVAKALISMELARVDPGWSSFFGVHAGLAMGAIARYGSPEQQTEWLPTLRRWERIAAFGLTEPAVGSGTAGGLTTRCRREGDDWVLNGQKKWIGNAIFADVVVIWASDEGDEQTRGFLVRTENPGYSAEKLEGKISQRTVQSGLITLADCRVPEADRLPGVASFADVARILRAGRAGVAWQAVGCAMGALRARTRLRP